MLIIFDFIQLTQASKLVKFNDPKRSSFTNLITLFWDISPNLLCHKMPELLLIIFLLLVHTRDTTDSEVEVTFNLNNNCTNGDIAEYFPEALKKVL